MPIRGVTVNGEVTNFFPDPRHRHLALLGRHLLEGDEVVFTDDDGSRRIYRVNEHQRLPPHVHLAPHVSHIRTEAPPPPPPSAEGPEPDDIVTPGPSVWERLKKPQLS